MQKKKIFSFILLGILILGGGLFFLKPKSQSFQFVSSIWKGGEISVTGEQILQANKIEVSFDLEITDRLIERFANSEDEISALLVVERLFDEEGRPNTINNEYYSTLLTPGGMPVEFSESAWGAPSKYNTKDELFFTTPIDVLKSVKIADIFDEKTQKLKTIHFDFEENIDEDFPAGLFRPRLYLFYKPKETPLNQKATTENNLLLVHQLLAPIQENFVSKANPWSSGNDYKKLREQINYLPIFEVGKYQTPQMPAVLFPDAYSQGSKGIVSDEDSVNFKISTHEISQSKLILEPGEYSLNPALPLVASFDTDLNVKTDRIPLLLKKGFLKGEIHLPNGDVKEITEKEIIDFGIVDEGPFQTGQAIAWKTIKTDEENSFNFKKSGLYKVVLEGEVFDEFKNKYKIGGSYDFYIGNKLTFSSAVKPGTPFFVGDAYIPRFAYFPSFPGKVKFVYTFFPFDKTKESYEKVIEQDDASGGFGGPSIPFDEPGEYHVEVFVQAKHFMMGDFYGTYSADAMVVERDSKLNLHGKIGGKFSDGTVIEEPRFIAERNPAFETRRELYFPYYSGDVLKIAANEKNAINPKMDVTNQNGEKITLIPRAEGNLHPFNYPEKITKNAYLFIASEKPGLVARSFVATDFLENGFWNVRNQTFANRLNVSKYGDIENDVYRNFATVYLEDDSQDWDATSYVSNITVAAENAKDDRVFAPFSEDFLVTRGKPQVFLVGTGLQKPLGANFSQYLHVFPAVGDVEINLSLADPNGIVQNLPSVFTDENGFTPVGTLYPMDIPGTWRVYANAKYNGIDDEDFYKVFVLAEDTEVLDLGIPYMSKITEDKLIIKSDFPSDTKNLKIDYQVIMPGVILDSNEIGISDFVQTDTSFNYAFDFEKINSVYKNYEINPLTRMALLYFYVSGESEGKEFRKFGTAMLRGDNLYFLGILPEH